MAIPPNRGITFLFTLRPLGKSTAPNLGANLRIHGVSNVLTIKDIKNAANNVFKVVSPDRKSRCLGGTAMTAPQAAKKHDTPAGPS